MPEKRMLVLGQAHMELSLAVPRFPGIGEHLTSDGAFRFTPGGRAAISAVAAAHLGARVMLGTRIGGDSNGKILKQYYDSCGIDTRFVKQDRNRQTALCEKIAESGDRRREIFFAGALDAISEEDFEDAFSAFPDALLLHEDLSSRLFSAACERAKEQSVPIFADLSDPKYEYPVHAKNELEAAVLGEAECYAMTDVFPDCLDDCVRACIRLSGKIRAKYFVLRLQGRGAYLTDGKYSEIVPSPDLTGEYPPVPGAFLAAFAHGYLKQNDPIYASKLAVAQDAYLSLYHDTYDAFPQEDALKDFCRKQNLFD